MRRAWLTGSIVGALACTPSTPEPTTKQAEPTTKQTEPATKQTEPTTEVAEPRPEPEPKPDPTHAPVEPPASELRKRVEDLAVVLDGELLGSDGVQCWATADWAVPRSIAREDQEPVKDGDRLYVIADSGVSKHAARGKPGEDEIEVGSTKLGPLILVAKQFEPPAATRLEPRRLAKPGKGVAELGAWLEQRLPYEVSAVGELVGSFGDGVDRIVVFEPKQWQDPKELEDEDAEMTSFQRSEIALLVAGDTPRGWLPFGSPNEDEPGVWELGAFGLQVFGVVDLDGDGTLEVAWLTQMPWGDPLTTAVTLSYYDGDRGFDVRDVGGCSYTGCEGFLPRKQCRGIVKPQG